jgi:FkbM family methyltransferase
MRFVGFVFKHIKMEKLKKFIVMWRCGRWTTLEAIIRALARLFVKYARIYAFLRSLYQKVARAKFTKKWLVQQNGTSYFDFKGAKLPDISSNIEQMDGLLYVFDDVFLFSCFFDDNYDKSIVERMDGCMSEGPFGYTDGAFDVTVKRGDVVIDAGAWIGDFSAYAASKGAVAFAFEPVKTIFDLLCQSAELNDGKIYPIQKGLGSSEGKVTFSVHGNNLGNSKISSNDYVGKTETICITTLDKFVEENKLTKVDFIKADIEGAERDMLRGATNILKLFAPKLAICTYHLPDDPEVLEKIILTANPNYRVVHLRHKLFAAVIK